jgi:hypothetical protein
MTLSVDTPADAFLQVTLPEELSFDSQKVFTCTATTNISKRSFPCAQTGPRDAVVTLNEATLGSNFARNGTTVTIDLGYIKNPSSTKPSSSFSLKTFVRDGQTDYLSNKIDKDVIVMCKEPGTVTIKEVTQVGSNELG